MCVQKVGLAGGGVEICCSLFISEIADNQYFNQSI